MTKLSLKKDFQNQIKKEILEFPEVEKVTMESVGMERGDDLRSFYEKNYSYRYKPGYILGNEKFFNWMFKNNGSQVATLSVGNKIVAHQGYIPVVFTDGENDYRGFVSASTMVDEDYRRKGLMSFLRKSVQDQFEMAMSLGGSAQGIALYSSMGYKNYGDLIRLIAIVDPQKCEGISQQTDKLKKTVQISSGTNDNVRSIPRFEEIKDELKELWDSVFPPKTYFGVKRDYEFLDWRYSEHPVFDYKRFGVWQNGKLQGVIVYRKQYIELAQTSVIHMVELFGQEQAIPELINFTVLNEAESSDVGWIHWFCSSKKLFDVLQKIGFLTPEQIEPSIIPIFCSPVDYYKTKYPLMFWIKDEEKHKQMPSLGKWYMTKGDGDADRPC